MCVCVCVCVCACITMKYCEGLITRLYTCTCRSVFNIEKLGGPGTRSVCRCMCVSKLQRSEGLGSRLCMYLCVCNIEMVGEPEDEATYMTVCTCTCVCMQH